MESVDPQVSIFLYHGYLLSDHMRKDLQASLERMIDGDLICVAAAGQATRNLRQLVCIAGDNSMGDVYIQPGLKGFNAMSSKVIAKLIDPDQAGSITHRCRQRRDEEFKRRFPDLADMRVLDLGGTAISWRVLRLRPLSVTLVNRDRAEEPAESWMNVVQADACAGGFGKYDLVFSNSLMEHLGGHARCQQFAEVVRESAPSWWIQTPYRYFPIEPHWLFPCFQFLPFRARLMVCQHWNTLHTPAIKETAEAAEMVASVELISATEMRTYFPDSEIWFERIAGLPKSLVSINAET